MKRDLWIFVVWYAWVAVLAAAILYFVFS